MIKAKGTKNGVEFVLIGLSRKNCELLLQGKPILINTQPLGLPLPILIMGGETEDDIINELEQSAELPPREKWNTIEEES